MLLIVVIFGCVPVCQTSNEFFDKKIKDFGSIYKVQDIPQLRTALQANQMHPIPLGVAH